MADATAASEPRSANGHGGGALQTTLGIASSAANLVLYPYVVAGKAAYSATSYAVHAPIKLTLHVKDSILGGASHGDDSVDTAADAAYDLFGEHSSSNSESESEQDDASAHNDTDLFGERYPTIIDASDPHDKNTVASIDTQQNAGVVSQLLFLPVRLVSTSVTTAAALPSSLLHYSGRKLSGAATTSKSLATTALVVSSSAVARTSRTVAYSLTASAFSTATFTAQSLTGAVNSAASAVPLSVTNAVWHSVDATRSASINVVASAIAVPAYRLLAAIVPEVAAIVSERDCVDCTRDAVLVLVQTFGPQNAFRILKWIYETVNSDAAFDLMLLCRDVVRESLDRDNYKRLGAAVATETTGVTTTIASVVEMLPSVDELLDVLAFVADVSDDVVTQLVAPPMPSFRGRRTVGSSDKRVEHADRFTYVDDDDDDDDENDEEDSDTTASDTDNSSSDTGCIESSTWMITTDAFERTMDEVGSSVKDVENAKTSDVVDAGVALLATACDSDAATLLFNTFGDMLDVLFD